MTLELSNEQLFNKLLNCKQSKEIEAILCDLEKTYGNRIHYLPIGNRENNRGQIDIGADPGKGIVERATNAIDGILDYEYEQHNGRPDPKNPRDAAKAWLGVPSKGLYELSPNLRHELSKLVTIKTERGENDSKFNISIIDKGIGISSNNMHKTILSLGESNKLTKHYLIGAFGQGGSSTFTHCDYTVIASRLNDPLNKKISFTIVFYEDLPANEYKHGRYVYVVLDNRLFEAEIEDPQFSTYVKHYGYDLSEYKFKLGPGSVYGLLQRALFDPILPVWLEDQAHDLNRTIKGSRNALNGAIDDEYTERGPDIQYNLPIYYIDLGDHGDIGIEYWVLKENKERRDYRPITGYVDPKHPVLLTLNGQTHAELSVSIIRTNAALPFIAGRLIIHIDCDRLSPQAKRKLFTSSREDVRKNDIAIRIKDEIIKTLQNDERLEELNEEAKAMMLTSQNEKSEEVIRKEIGKFLSFQGYTLQETNSITINNNGITSNPPPIVRPPNNKPIKIIDLKDPPTYVKILSPDVINFYPTQRKYIRIETDAPSSYNQTGDMEKERFNVRTSSTDLKYCGSSPLVKGRMRIILESTKEARVGNTGEIVIEIFRSGFSALSDTKTYQIIEIPKSKPSDNKVSVPPINFVEVNFNDENWQQRGWSQDINANAYSSILDKNSLTIFFSTVFPQFYERKRKIENNKNSLEIFIQKYKTLIGVHSLLLEDKRKEVEDSEDFEKWEREERCRFAIMAAFSSEQFIDNTHTPDSN